MMKANKIVENLTYIVQHKEYYDIGYKGKHALIHELVIRPTCTLDKQSLRQQIRDYKLKHRVLQTVKFQCFSKIIISIQ